MQETKNKKNISNDESNKKKERHIVTWTQQEDDILREQISLHGTENWTIIASKFKDKTTRQCRRRWYTYLNSDFKKGGWSPEEDMLLCEAQKIFGNRWTEIAKVVSGRTDNAVKNRFSTLCKKRAKYEALAKENKTSFINQNNKRIIIHNGFNADGTPDTSEPFKKMRRSHISDHSENTNLTDRLHKRSGTTVSHQPRPPFAVLVENFHNVNDMAAQHPVTNVKEVSLDVGQNNKIHGTYLKTDDPKITALMQQAELLSSLALKVNAENTDQSLENAWKVLQDFLNRSKENDIVPCRALDFDFQVEEFKELLEDFRSSNEGSQPPWRQPELYEESPASSEYSTGSTLMPHLDCDKPEHVQAEFHQDSGIHVQAFATEEQNVLNECGKQVLSKGNADPVEIFAACEEQTMNNEVISALSCPEFSSPLQVNPLFRSLAAGIPSPQFSESERNFLLKTLGIESPTANTSINPSQPPPCKRALLQSL
ncbi:MYB family protein [Tripterygium wilfordii]|uniref:MYB family protein n=1 Tax=Tripterygium wilfordii TaxID=458696 RepID=A0A7J7BYN9_TRIWF|nr:transcription factor MYB124 [Tripterygium wilfordii]KAF5726805.1 MYB family protein [Tripterygium wilfordii]